MKSLVDDIELYLWIASLKISFYVKAKKVLRKSRSSKLKSTLTWGTIVNHGPDIQNYK